ncbi:hypothetical protein J6590_043157 [Homalodisca vitripennis]|nr:hypothetical protein J6590_043157 [Homalodisca vitripennis]
MTTLLLVNLHHNTEATVTLYQNILSDDIGLIIIQERWTVSSRVMGMTTAKALKDVYLKVMTTPESCLQQFTSRTILQKHLNIKHLIDRCDANAHYTAWGSMKQLLVNAERPRKSLSKEDWNCAETAINYSRIKWALNSVKHFKSPGTNATNKRLEELSGKYSNVTLVQFSKAERALHTHQVVTKAITAKKDPDHSLGLRDVQPPPPGTYDVSGNCLPIGKNYSAQVEALQNVRTHASVFIT